MTVPPGKIAVWFDPADLDRLLKLQGGPVANEARPSGQGVAVIVRMQPALLARLDAARGGETRPAAIRALLEKHLP